MDPNSKFTSLWLWWLLKSNLWSSTRFRDVCCMVTVLAVKYCSACFNVAVHTFALVTAKVVDHSVWVILLLQYY